MRQNTIYKTLAAVIMTVLIFFAAPVVGHSAESDVDQLAMQLANPVADLTTLPFQFNYDANIGPDDDGERITLNIQPVIPIELNDRWNQL